MVPTRWFRAAVFSTAALTIGSTACIFDLEKVVEPRRRGADPAAAGDGGEGTSEGDAEERDGGSVEARDATTRDAQGDGGVEPEDDGGPSLFVVPLCGACTAADDCEDGGACIDLGNEIVCGRDCSLAGCPSGYRCTFVFALTGSLQQCIPLSGTCNADAGRR